MADDLGSMLLPNLLVARSSSPRHPILRCCWEWLRDEMNIYAICLHRAIAYFMAASSRRQGVFLVILINKFLACANAGLINTILLPSAANAGMMAFSRQSPGAYRLYHDGVRCWYIWLRELPAAAIFPICFKRLGESSWICAEPRYIRAV